MKKQIQTSRDALLKGAVEDFCEDFLYFFFPDHIHLFDLEKGFEFLDKELIEIRPKSKGNQRYSDKLVKVFMRDGSEEWILVHIEMQGYDDPEFRERMFIYYYRILDKYQKRVTAIAIMTDDSNDHPTRYETSFIGTKLIYEFNSYKLKSKTPEDFANTDNPFAIIMEVAWYALKNNQLDDEALYNFKIQLVRRLKTLNYDSEKIRALFNFIKQYVNFEKLEINLKFEQQSNIIFENQGTMGIIEAIIDDTKRQVREQTIAEVREEVRKEAIAEVRKEAIAEVRKEVKEERKTTIQNLQNEGFSNEKIAVIMGISIEEVLRLL